MQDLTGIAGLAVGIDGGNLQFNEAVTPPRLSVRVRSNLEPVWRAPALQPADPELYGVYWGAVPTRDEPVFREQDLDHTYVIIHPGVWQGEYFKTQGHYHPPMAANRLGHPELYHVLAGRGLFLLQHANPPDWQVDEVLAVDVEPGSIVVVQPDYGHLTINYGTDELVFEAFLTNGLKPVTASYQARQGGAAYCLETPEGPQIVPNARYEGQPLIQRSKATAWDLAASGAFYSAVARHLERFAWLREPDSFDLNQVESELRELAGAGQA